MKQIYVSPHSDDVALSCSGQIITDSEAGRDIVILNIFASDRDESASALITDEAKFKDSIGHARTQEDKLAWESINIATEHAEIPEALLRNRFPFSILPSSIDESLMSSLYGILTRYVKLYPDAVFYFPAGFGNHVDHLACKQVAFRLLDDGVVSKIMLYEDIPYSWLRFIRNRGYQALMRDVGLDKADLKTAFRPDGENLLSYLAHKAVPFPRGKLLFATVYSSLLIGNAIRCLGRRQQLYYGRIKSFSLNEDVAVKKQHLIWKYRSQIPMLFGSEPEKLISKYLGSFSTEVIIEIKKI